MATVTVSEQDVIDADIYLSTYLREKIPEADFSQGSALRDFVVKAIAHIFAFFRAEAQKTRDHQSILALQKLEPSAEVDEAVDAILSNLFIGRRTGLRARVVATLHFTNSVDVVIPITTRFFRDGQAFTIDSSTNVFISGNDLRQVLLTTTGSAEYVTTVTLIAQTPGVAGNVTPGRFSGADRFNQFFSYAENADYGAGGKDDESTDELLERAPTAIAVRNLTNVRSVDAVMKETFPELTEVFTAGFGDPEMVRDRASEAVTQIAMHTGGYMDVYVKLPLVTMTETHDGDADFKRADGLVLVFKDAGVDFAGLGVIAGDVLKIHSGLPGSPREYIIKSVSGDRLFFSEKTPFPEEAQGLPYSIGALSPLYEDKVSVSLSSTGETTNYVKETDRVFLDGRPRGKIRKFELSLDDGTTWQTLERVNLESVTAGQYSVTNLTPALFQSLQAVERVNLPAGSTTASSKVRVTFDTLAGFETVSQKVIDTFERNVCANNMVRGFVPVYVAVAGTYALEPGAELIDDTAIRAALATFIYDWPATKPLDVSAITSFLRQTFPTINRFYDPVTLLFTVYAHDGQLYEFQTTDVVSVFPDGQSKVSLRGAGAHTLRDELLLGGLRFPESPAAFNASLLSLRSEFRKLGITERNVRFFPDTDGMLITPFID